MEKERITCQCGHENPIGTHLCEACGRPLSQEAKDSKIVDMRYEGSARRSKTKTTSPIDKVWNFFSSVTVGVWIIVILLVTSALGTIFPQRMYVGTKNESEIAAYYETNYGFLGKMYYTLGFDDMYGSWWFKILVGMLAISIIIASVDRVVPLYKSLTKQRTRRHASFMRRQRIVGEGAVQDADASLQQASEQLKALKYNVKVEDDAVLAEKGRFSRWGPYVNHTGLIIFLFGVLLRGLPGFYVDDTMWLREGDLKQINSAPGFYLENNSFIVEYYTKEEADEVFGTALDNNAPIAKNYQTNVTLYKDKEGALPGSQDLEKVKDYEIIVNKPLTFDGYSVFQMDFRLNELSEMKFNLVEKTTGEPVGEVAIDLQAPQKEYDLGNGYRVKLKNFFPDFSGMKDGEPQNASPIPNNPAFIFEMITPEMAEGAEGELSFVAIMQTLELGDNDYEMKFAAAETRNMSGLTIRKDKTLWILLIGGVIFMIGVAQGSYWQHRRIWIQKDTNGELLLAGHTNKNWFTLKKELDKVKEVVELPAYEDRDDKEAEKDLKNEEAQEGEK